MGPRGGMSGMVRIKSFLPEVSAAGLLMLLLDKFASKRPAFIPDVLTVITSSLREGATVCSASVASAML